MTEYEFDLSTVNSITVEAEDGDGAIEALLGTIELKVTKGAIPSEEIKAFDVKSMGTGCRYTVEGATAAEAERTLEIYLNEKKEEALGEIQPHEAGYDLLIDFNVACKVIGEATGPVEINREGNRVE